MKLLRKSGDTSNILTIFILDATSITGAGLAGLDETSGIIGGYVREGGTGVALNVNQNVLVVGTYQAPTLASQVRIGTPVNMIAGTYELHFHDSLFASGAKSLTITLTGAVNMVPLPIEIQLTGFDPVSTTDLGLSTLTGNIPQTADHTSAIAAIDTAPMRGTNNSLTDKAGFSLSTAGIAGIWDALLTGILAVGSIGKLIKDFLDVAVSSRNAVAPPTVVSIRQEMDTNSTKLASITEARLSELDGINIPADIDSLVSGVIVSQNNDKSGYTILAGGIAVGSIANGAITDASTSLDFEAAIRDSVWQKVVEVQGSFTAQQTLSVLLAMVAGVTTVNGATVKTTDALATRAVFTYDSNNNRLTSTITASA